MVCVRPFLTDTLPTNVLFVAHVALAAVACRRRDAASIQTQVGEMFADVDGVIHRHRAWMQTADNLNTQKDHRIQIIFSKNKAFNLVPVHRETHLYVCG